MTAINRIGVLAHPTRPQTAPIAEDISASLQAHGVDTWLYTHWDADDVKPHLQDTDMVIAIGGDGAMLRSARVCAPYRVPVLGVNMGYLGFLTEIASPDHWDVALADVLAGNFWVEQRMMIETTVWKDGQSAVTGEGLNETVIGRGSVTRLIRLNAYIDGGWITTYSADALIIATATGSTAYALAAGGPILPPQMRNILIVPVAPHLSLDRPIVLPEGVMVEVVVAPETQGETVVAVDGEQLAEIAPGDRVCVKMSDHVSRFVRLREPTYFYRSLLDRMEPRIAAPPAPERRQL